MTLEDLELPLIEFKGIGRRTAEKFQKNKIFTIKDLLYFFPYRYDDLRNVTQIKDAPLNENVVIVGRIKNLRLLLTPKKKMIIVQGIVEDETGSLKVIWFNQAYIAKVLSGGPKVMLYGKLLKNKYGLHLSDPDFKILKGNTKFKGEIIPVYKEIEGIPSSFTRRIISEIFKKFPIEKIQDPIPEIIRLKANIPEISKAFLFIHLPKTLEEIELAKKRFLFEEMFYLQIKINQEKILLKLEKAPIINYDQNLIDEFLQRINITLTNSQKEVLNEIIEDFRKPYPMNRLIQGETGSGKTLLAELASLLTVNSGYIVILMAPTEILANQHFHRFLQDFSYYDFGIGLLTKDGGYYGVHGFKAKKSKEDIARLVSLKKINILIGTHALIENPIPYPDVGLVIVDEQQRFGVAQRKRLLEKSSQNYLPHFLSMTATPIPRTLYLAFYGDLSLSILKEKPPGRKDVKTFVIDKEHINEVWSFVRKELEKGHQVFVVCPRVEKSDSGKYEVRTVKEEFEKIKKLFPEYNVAMLHGRMKNLEKEMIMRKMQSGEIQILVSSSVVEVGIDLPLATVIVIEGAERFGLAQLHQLRGRVGRSIHESYCFLIPETYTPLSFKRLKILEESQDAFYIAEKDLELRGPGELLGEKQSGIPDLAMEALSKMDIVTLAQQLAQEFVSNNPQLTGYPLLRREIEKRGEIILG